MKKRNLPANGILLMLLSAFFFAGKSALVKLAGEMPSIEKTFLYSTFSLLFTLLLTCKKHIPCQFPTQRRTISLLFLRAVLGAIGIFCNFHNIDHIPLSDANMLAKTTPFFTILFSALFLHEKPSRFEMGCVTIALCGCLFVLRPSLSMATIASIAFFGTVAQGLAHTVLRALKRDHTVPNEWIVLFYSALTMLFTAPIAIMNWEKISSIQLLLLGLAGIFGAGAQLALTGAYTYGAAKELSIYSYAQIVFSALLGFILFDQTPDSWSFYGYLIIFGAAFMMYMKQKKGSSP